MTGRASALRQAWDALTDDDLREAIERIQQSGYTVHQHIFHPRAFGQRTVSSASEAALSARCSGCGETVWLAPAESAG